MLLSRIKNALSCYAIASIISEVFPIISFLSNLWRIVFLFWPLLGPPFDTKTYGKALQAPGPCCLLNGDVLLLNRLDAFPSAAQSLLPQADPVVASADCEGIAAQTPAHAPCGGVDVNLGAFPLA